MKISELIKSLQKIKKENGDLPVYCFRHEGGTSLRGDTVVMKPKFLYFWDHELVIGSEQDCFWKTLKEAKE